jgi:hypothetical protein
VSQGLIGSALYSYVSGSYILDFKLSPWKGYWVRAFANVVLRIDPRTDQFGRAAATPSTSRAVLYGGDGWSVNLRVRVGDTHDDDNYFGMATRAADGFDRYKMEKPPLFGERYTYLTFDHTDWGDKSGGYGVDVRSASTTAKTWEFTVKTNVANSSGTLTWPNMATAGRKVTLLLTDLATGKKTDMRTTGAYVWQTGEQPASRRFKIEAKMTGITDVLRITNLNASGNGNRANRTAQVSYNLSTTADVEVRILSATGSQVRRVKGRATRAAGIQQESWDLKNDQGVVMPAGTYMFEIKAQTADGKTVRAVTPVIILR